MGSKKKPIRPILTEKRAVFPKGKVKKVGAPTPAQQNNTIRISNRKHWYLSRIIENTIDPITPIATNDAPM